MPIMHNNETFVKKKMKALNKLFGRFFADITARMIQIWAYRAGKKEEMGISFFLIGISDQGLIFSMQHFLNFLPLPQGHGLLRLTFAYMILLASST